MTAAQRKERDLLRRQVQSLTDKTRHTKALTKAEKKAQKLQEDTENLARFKAEAEKYKADNEVQALAIERLVEEEQDLKDKLAKSEAENEELRKTLATKGADLKDALAVNADLEKRDEQRIEEYKILEEEYDELVDRYKELDAEKDNLEEEYGKKLDEKKVNLKKKHNRKLAEEKKELETSYGLLFGIKDEQMALSAKSLAEANAKLEDTKSALHEKELELKACKDRINKTEIELENTKATPIEKGTKLEESELIIADVKAKLETCESTLSGKEAALRMSEESMAKAQIDLANAKSAFVEKEAELSDNEELLVAVCKQFEVLKEKHRDFKAKWEQHDCVEELSKPWSNEEISTLETELKSARDSYQDLIGYTQSNHQERVTNVRSLETKTKEMRTEIWRHALEATRLKNQLRECAGDRDAYAGKLVSAEESLKDFEELKVQFSHGNNKIVKLKAELAAAKVPIEPPNEPAPAGTPETSVENQVDDEDEENIASAVSDDSSTLKPTPPIELLANIVLLDASEIYEEPEVDEISKVTPEVADNVSTLVEHSEILQPSVKLSANFASENTDHPRVDDNESIVPDVADSTKIGQPTVEMATTSMEPSVDNGPVAESDDIEEPEVILSENPEESKVDVSEEDFEELEDDEWETTDELEDDDDESVDSDFEDEDSTIQQTPVFEAVNPNPKNFGIILFLVIIFGFLSAGHSLWSGSSNNALQTCYNYDFYSVPPNSSSWSSGNNTQFSYGDHTTKHVLIKCRPSQTAKNPVYITDIGAYISRDIVPVLNPYHHISSLTPHANQLWESLKDIYALSHQHWENWTDNAHYRREKFWQLARLPYRLPVCTYKAIAGGLEASFKECLFS